MYLHGQGALKFQGGYPEPSLSAWTLQPSSTSPAPLCEISQPQGSKPAERGSALVLRVLALLLPNLLALYPPTILQSRSHPSHCHWCRINQQEPVPCSQRSSKFS